MKLIRQIDDLNKAIKQKKILGFVPTMGSLHKGHESLIKISKKKCKHTLVTIFVNPTQFNKIEDFKNYPRNLNKDLKLLKKLKVDLVFMPTVLEMFKNKKSKIFNLNSSQKILCAKFRKGHFEGVLDIMNRFISLIHPQYVFMGEKDFQQLFLVKHFLQSKYKTKIISCKTIRDKNLVALSSRNNRLNLKSLNTASLISKKLHELKIKIYKNRNRCDNLIKITKKNFIKKLKIKIEYLEVRNTSNLNRNIIQKKFKIFIAYYINKVRLIDNI